jgi:hypothetical protein
MYINDDVIKDCLTQIVATQYPWGEFADILRDPNDVGRDLIHLVTLKPNGFRTMFAIDALESWIQTGYPEIKESALTWLSSSIENDGWTKLFFKPRITGSVTPVAGQGEVTGVRPKPDIRHTAQAIYAVFRYSEPALKYLNSFFSVLEKQREAGEWSYFDDPDEDAEKDITTMSCLLMLHEVLHGSDYVRAMITREKRERECIRRHANAVTFFRNNLFARHTRPLFTIGTCTERLHAVFQQYAPELLDEATDWIRDRYDPRLGRWPCDLCESDGQIDQEVKINGLAYATFAKLADLGFEEDLSKLRSVASYLSDNLGKVPDIMAAFYAILGQRIIYNRSGKTIEKCRLPDLKGGESFQRYERRAIRFWFVVRLKILSGLHTLQEESRTWRSVYADECSKTDAIGQRLVTIEEDSAFSQHIGELLSVIRERNPTVIAKKLEAVNEFLKQAHQGEDLVECANWWQSFRKIVWEFSAEVAARVIDKKTSAG